MVRCCKAFIPLFQDEAILNSYVSARIINVASIMGLLSLGSTTAYASSKHVAIAFTAGPRMELKGFGVQVSLINPSFHGTGLVSILKTSGRDSMPALVEGNVVLRRMPCKCCLPQWTFLIRQKKTSRTLLFWNMPWYTLHRMGKT